MAGHSGHELTVKGEAHLGEERDDSYRRYFSPAEKTSEGTSSSLSSFEHVFRPFESVLLLFKPVLLPGWHVYLRLFGGQ